DKQFIVFVHGAWGGGWDYKNMEEILESDGYKVYRPTLTGQGEREHLNSPDVNLDTHMMDIVNVI
ncbi:MAG: alpha/beta hydrolase, partial [Ignavibacteriae bacterium]|nr:alpha/beta hydrolase [Ignavibacteriota bacterium]